MPVVSVEISDKLAKNLKPFTIIQFETLVWDYFNDEENIEFDFKKENINQDEFLSYLKSKVLA